MSSTPATPDRPDSEVAGAHGLLRAGDLIEDRELTAADDDRFDHKRIADQLVELATTVETPTNIALYGPWGSGKTGIANLMKAKLQDRKGVRFIRFDAFKYAENPLRRNFLMAAARELGVTKPKYHEDLYAGRTRTDISVPPANTGRLIGVFLALLFSICMVMAGIIALIAWVRAGSFSDNFSSMAGTAVTAGLVPATLLSGLIALAGKNLQAERSMAKPDSDEQFEKLLTELVDDSKADRLVIFVDELDRCSSDDVVATLDAVRTFLGTDRCVFVVAADQLVLEEALSRKSQQPTPGTAHNPYYSTGSAYLDKVFQYQVSLPSLLETNIDHFALDLVSSRKSGVWSELTNLPYVVSVLIPSHVTSPRRVKHLLNAFAITYRLAEDRHRTNQLHENPVKSATALAKLVCLRVEFPLFARDLTTDPDLPAHVLTAHDTGTIPEDLEPEAKLLVESYKEPAAELATMITGSTDEHSSDDERRLTDTRHCHHRQLLNYLRRTQTIEGPSRALIYLRSEESLFGIEEAMANRLLSSAEDGDSATVLSLLDADEVSDDKREAMLRYLTNRMRRSFGVAEQNLTQVLLELVDHRTDLPFAVVADEIIDSLYNLTNSGNDIVTARNSPGAWRLTMFAVAVDVVPLRRKIIRISLDEDTACQFILATPAAAAADPGGVSKLIENGLCDDDPEITLDTIRRLRGTDRRELLDLALDLPATLSARLKSPVPAPTPAVQSAATGGNPAQPAEAPEAVQAKQAIEALASLAEEMVTDDPATTHALVRLLLKVDHVEARNRVQKVLPGMPQTADAALVEAIIQSTQRRLLQPWPLWLGTIEPGPYPEIAQASWNGLAERLWDRCTAAEAAEIKDVETAASALLTVVEPLDTEQPDVTDTVTGRIGRLAETDAEAAAKAPQVEAAYVLARHRFVDRKTLTDTLLSTLAETVRAPIAEADRGPSLQSYLDDWIPHAFADAIASQGPTDLAVDLMTALTEEGWMRPFDRLRLLLLSLERANPGMSAFRQLLPDANTVNELVDSYAENSARLLELWLQLTSVTAAEARTLLKTAQKAQALTTEVAAAFQGTTRTFTKEDRVAFAEAFLPQRSTSPPPHNLITAIGLASAPEDGIAELLVDRYKSSTNNMMRTVVLELWAAASISGEAERIELFNSIAIPMLQLKSAGGTNAEAVRTLLKAMPRLGAPPRTAKKPFLKAVEQAVSGNRELENTALNSLAALGFATKKASLLGSRRVIDFDK